jgi:glutamyl-tRNA synthetase
MSELLDVLIEYVSDCDWTADALDLRELMTEHGFNPGKTTMPPLYAVFEGTTSGLPLFDSILLLGRERALRRLRDARAKL